MFTIRQLAEAMPDWVDAEYRYAVKRFMNNNPQLSALKGERLKCETNMLTCYEVGFRGWATSTLPHARQPVEDEPPHVFTYLIRLVMGSFDLNLFFCRVPERRIILFDFCVVPPLGPHKYISFIPVATP